MSLGNTIFEDLRVAGKLDRDENRNPRFGALELAKASTLHPNSIVTAEMLNQLPMSQGRTTQIPVLQRGNVTVKNARSCNIALNETGADLVTVVWATYAVDITMRPHEYHNNEITYQRDFLQKFNEAQRAIGEDIEGSIITLVDSNISQVFNSNIANSKYTPVANALQVPLGDQNLFLNEMQAIQEADDCIMGNGDFDVLTHTDLMPTFATWANQGDGNNTNTSFQFPGHDFASTRFVTNTALSAGTGYHFPKGSVGIVFRQSLEAMAGDDTTDGSRWSLQPSPMLGTDMSVYFKSTCSDASAVHAGTSHLTQTKLEQWEVSVDVALFAPYNSNPGGDAGCIKKFDFLTT